MAASDIVQQGRDCYHDWASVQWRSRDSIEILDNAVSVDMVITPSTTWARGPVVAHERVDDIAFPDGTRIKGRYIAVFTLHDGKIVDFLGFDF